MNKPAKELLVRRALWVNAAFSLLAGVGLLAASKDVAQRLSDGNVSALIFASVGASLLPFAIAVGFSAWRRQLHTSHVLVISLMDLGWVAATLCLGLLWPNLFNSLGWGCAAVVAVLVAFFCLSQLYGLRHLNHNDARSPGEGRSVITAERTVPVSAERAWAIIADLDGYANYVPTLHFSRVLKDAGEGLVRECGDENGRWTERASLWDEGKAYAFRVDTGAPDYPFPFKVLGGRWEVSAVDGGARIGMRFDASMKGGLLGDVLLSVVLVPQFRDNLETLLDNWEAALRGAKKTGTVA